MLVLDVQINMTQLQKASNIIKAKNCPPPLKFYIVLTPYTTYWLRTENFTSLSMTLTQDFSVLALAIF